MMDVRLSAQGIPYLTPDVMEEYSHLRVFSCHGELVRMNPLFLAALNSSLVTSIGLQDCEDCSVVTEFSKYELELVKEFFGTGQVTDHNCNVLRAFGIDLENMFNPRPALNNNVKVELNVKEEPFDPIEYEYEKYSEYKTKDYYDDDYDYYDDEDADYVPVPKKKKRKDENWIPRKTKRSEGFTDEHRELFKVYELPKPLEAYRKKAFETRIKNPDKRVIDYNKNFKCEICEARFSANTNLQDHLIKYHHEHYDCHLCKRSFKLDEADDFKLHMFKHEQNLLSTSSTTCIQCGRFCRFGSRYQEHIKNRGPFHDDQCAQCPEKFTTYEDYKNHVQVVHYGYWKYKCGHCKQLFDDQKVLKAHVHVVHLGKIKSPPAAKKKTAPIADKVCEECGINVRNLNSHVNQVHRDFKLPCPHCDHLAKNKYALKRHVDWFHDEIPCEFCGVMIGKGKMKEHVSFKHTSIYDRKFKCDICGKGFNDNAKLAEHRNVHTGEKPFKCKFCNACFASRGNQRMHERAHLGHKRK